MLNKAGKLSDYPLISIVTVNYNHSSDTIDFLDSMKNAPYPNLEYIIVDNGSEESDYNRLKNAYPDYEYIRIEINCGFAGANNRGLEKATGDYILCINNDIIITHDFISPMLNKLRDNPDIGVVCPKVYFYDPPQNLQYTGYTEFNNITIRNHGIGYNEPDNGQFEEDKITAYAIGAAMLFSREVLIKVGLMSEYFFLYYEDMDWGRRVRNAGYKIGYVHNAKVYHKDSVTTGQNSPNFTYYNNRGRLIYMRRNIRFPKVVLSTLYLYAFALPKNVLTFILKKQNDNALAMIKAYSWFIIHMFDKDIKDNPMMKS